MTHADDPRAVLSRAPDSLLIAGEWVPASDGSEFSVENPADESALTAVADAGPRDAASALDAAHGASDEWAATTSRVRSDILRAGYDAVMDQQEHLATILTLEMGKPLEQSRGEVRYAADYLRWFSEEAVRIDGDYRASPTDSSRMIIMRQPVGVALTVTSWNFPLVTAARDVGPALAAGCPIIVKPAPETPLATLALGACLQDAGLPPGVLGLLPSSRGEELVDEVIDDRRLRALAFTGSEQVGRELVAESAEQSLRISMELGGNAPFLVFADADIERAVQGALEAKTRNHGESCTAANRLLVADEIADEFVDAFVGEVERLRIGDGFDPDVDLGPMISADQLAETARLADDAIAQGATALAGGHDLPEAGHYYAPTVLVDVDHDSEILRREIFGPVAPVVTFSSEEEAITMANATVYGLVAYIYTQDLARALRVAERIETGMIGLNQGAVSNVAAPFGGVKRSGSGRKGGRMGIDEYLETKYVSLGVDLES